jgi:hypothetical protein
MYKHDFKAYLHAYFKLLSDAISKEHLQSFQIATSGDGGNN